MNTGLKTVDNLIRTFGIRIRNGADKSQSLVTLSSADERLASMRIPFCMMQKILSLPQNRSLRFHQWYLPHKGAKLACFLIDEEGRIVEQGTHAQLLQRGAHYAALHAIQFRDIAQTADIT